MTHPEGMTKMEIQRQDQSPFTVLSLAGNLDANTCENFDTILRGEIAQGHVQLILDLAKLNYVSSAGLRSILAAVKQVREKGGDLLCVSVQTDVAHVFELSGLASLIKIYPDLKSAMMALGE